MTDIRIALGQFSYATGNNLGENTPENTGHRADTASMSAANKNLILTVENDDHTINSGEKIGFRFLDIEGNQITVENAVVQQTAFADGGAPNMSGVLTAQGVDQDGNSRALLLNFNATGFPKGRPFFDTDDDSRIANNTDIELDRSIKLLYLGTFPDVDVNERNQSSDPGRAHIFSNVTCTGDDVLQLVDMQPQDQHGGIDTAILDNDSPTPRNDKLDRLCYNSRTSGKEVIGHIDSTATYKADIKLADASVVDDQDIVVIQMTNGDTFIAGLSNNFDNKTFQAVTIREPVNIRSSGFIDTQTIKNARVVCFMAGTMIETAGGTLPVEALRVGDLVITADNGLRPISWIGQRKLDAAALDTNPNLMPIRIQSGALGPNKPSRNLIVSPQHRILISSDAAQNITGDRDVLIAAKHLLSIEGIDVAVDIDEINYVHFLFDQHELVYANGAITESMFTGPQALQSVSPAARAEIFEIFPELKGGAQPTPCRLLTKGKTGRAIATAIASERASTQIWLQ